MDEQSKSAKMLIVDDEARTIDTLRQKFKKKYIVETASSTEEALEKYKLDTFDVAIVDYSMGNLDGTHVISELRKHLSAERIFLISTENWLGDDIMASGDYIFVSKSDANDLDKFVEAALRKPRQS